MNARYLSIMFAIVTAVCLPSAAMASLADDFSAITQGTQSFSRTDDPKFFAHIDYAVYTSSTYPGSLTFPANKYIYCYQIFNDTTSTKNVTSFTVNVDTSLIGYTPYLDAASGSGSPGGKISLTPFDGDNFITYNFGRNAFASNNYSAVLLFTSDYNWMMGTGIVTDSSDTVNNSFIVNIPIPTPEPASLLIMAMAAPALLRTRRIAQ
jgi:hypothetical protein